MGTVEEIQTLIDQYNNNPDEVVQERMDEIVKTINTLTNDSENSLYAYLIKEKMQLLLSPMKWIDNQLIKLYDELFYVDDTLELKKKFLCQEVNKLRYKKIYTRFPYTFPDGTQDYIQIRNEQDRQNIQDFFITAQRKITNNNNDIMYFRTESDITKELYPTDVLDLNEAMETWIYSFFIASWTHKENILNLNTNQELDDYDYTINWPGESI